MFAEDAPLGERAHPLGQLLLPLPVHGDHLHLVHRVPHQLEPIDRGKSSKKALDAGASYLPQFDSQQISKFLASFILVTSKNNCSHNPDLGNPVEEEDVHFCLARGVE